MKSGISSAGFKGGSAPRAGGTAVGRGGGIERGSFGSVDAGKFSSRSFASFNTEKGKPMRIATRTPVPSAVFDKSPQNFASISGNSEKSRNYASVARNNYQIGNVETSFGKKRNTKAEKIRISPMRPRNIIFERPQSLSSPLIVKEIGSNTAVDRRLNTFPSKSRSKVMTKEIDRAPFQINQQVVNGKPEFSIQALPRQPDINSAEKRYGKYQRETKGENKRYFGEIKTRENGKQRSSEEIVSRLQQQHEKKNARKRHFTKENNVTILFPLASTLEKSVRPNVLKAPEKSGVKKPGSQKEAQQTIRLKTFPQSIDFERIRKLRSQHGTEKRLREVRELLESLQYNAEQVAKPIQVVKVAPVESPKPPATFKELFGTSRKEAPVEKPKGIVDESTKPLKQKESNADMRQAARVKLALMNLYFTRDQAEEFVLPQLEQLLKKKNLPKPELEQSAKTEDEWQLALKLKEKVEDEEKLKTKLKKKIKEEETTFQEEQNGEEKKKKKERPPEIIEEWDKDTDEYREVLTENAVEVAAVRSGGDIKEPGILTGRIIADQLPIQQTPQMKSKLLYQIFAIGDMLRDGSWEKVRNQIAGGGKFLHKEDAIAFVKKTIAENPAVRLNDTLETRPVTPDDIAKVLEYHNAVVPHQAKKGKFNFMSVFH